MNKSVFIAQYAAHLRESYEWAKDEARLIKFLDSVRATLDGANTWNHDGSSVTAAWRAIGGKGKPTLKALRALPE